MNSYFDRVLTLHPDLESVLPDLERSFEMLVEAFNGGNQLLLCGNGGSAADCEHIAAELVNKFEMERPIADELKAKYEQQFGDDGVFLAHHLQRALPAISLVSQSALTSALANDVGAPFVFAQQVAAYGRTGDVLMGISTSGNSANVLHALRVAKIQGLKTIGFTGRDGGEMKALCDVCLVVPRMVTAQIQEAHLPLYHALCGALENHFFGS